MIWVYLPSPPQSIWASKRAEHRRLFDELMCRCLVECVFSLEVKFCVDFDLTWLSSKMIMFSMLFSEVDFVLRRLDVQDDYALEM